MKINFNTIQLILFSISTFVKQLSGSRLLSSSSSHKHYRLVKNNRHLTTSTDSNIKYSTFVTLLDRNFVTPYYVATTLSNKNPHQIINNKSDNTNLYHIFSGITLNFEQLRLFFIGIIILLIIIVAIFFWLIKKFSNCFNNCFLLKCCCNRMCMCCIRKSIESSESESALSGECRCTFRIRKDNKQNYKKNNLELISNSNQKLLNETIYNNNLKPNLKRMISVSLNEIDTKKNYFKKLPLNKVKSALVLITLKPNESYEGFESMNSISTDKLVAKTIISEEDLNEYTENYLIINMQRDLVYLDNINKLRN